MARGQAERRAQRWLLGGGCWKLSSGKETVQLGNQMDV
jgi:hypothetical protein